MSWHQVDVHTGPTKESQKVDWYYSTLDTMTSKHFCNNLEAIPSQENSIPTFWTKYNVTT